MRQSLTGFTALTALAVLASSPARADDAHELSIGSTTRSLRSESANALTGDSLGGGRLTYAHALPVELVPGLRLWAEGAFGWGGVEGMMFQTLSTEISSQTFAAGARARYALHRRIVASARVDLGLARATLALQDGAGRRVRDTGWGALSEAALALDLLAIRSRRVSLGLRFELGVVGAAPISLTPAPESSGDGTLQLAMSAASLGSLNLSGAVFAASVVSQF